MTTFLLVVPLPQEHTPLAEQLARVAICFFETQGKVERADLGRYLRTGRKDAPIEVLHLVQFQVHAERMDAGARARALEGILRSTVAAAGVRGIDTRVFVSAT
jgi:hypothetical protein